MADEQQQQQQQQQQQGLNFPLHVNHPGPLKLGHDSVEEWKIFKQLFKNYRIITELDKKGKEYRTAVFLHCVGPAGIKVYNSLEFAPAGPENNPPAEDKEDIDTIIKKFDECVIGDTNETYERYVFNRRDQHSGENIESYITALRDLAKTCNFCNCLHDSLIRDRLVLGILDNGTRKLLLQKKKLTLKEAISICKGAEATQTQMKSMGSASPSVHSVKGVKI